MRNLRTRALVAVIAAALGGLLAVGCASVQSELTIGGDQATHTISGSSFFKTVDFKDLSLRGGGPTPWSAGLGAYRGDAQPGVEAWAQAMQMAIAIAPLLAQAYAAQQQQTVLTSGTLRR